MYKNISSKNGQDKKDPNLVYFEEHWIQLSSINPVLKALV